MSVIEASSGNYRSRVDGTIVLSVEIEPLYRTAALELFGQPGTPMALAALKVGTPRQEPPKLKPKAHIGEACWQAVDLCSDARFWEWVQFATLNVKQLSTEAEAKAYVLDVCGIESRKDLDIDHEARDRFNVRLFRPFNQWLEHKRHKLEGVA